MLWRKSEKSSGGDSGNCTQAGKCTVVQVSWQTWIFSRSVSYIRISSECVLINFFFLFDRRKNLAGHNIQESHFCSRKVGTDAAFWFLWHFAESTPFHNYKNAQETTQYYRFAPLFKTEASGMKRRAEERTVVTCHVACPELLRP
jgi:hypothetical protein